MYKTGRFESWERIFIQLCKPIFKGSEIAEYLNRKVNSVWRLKSRGYKDISSIIIGHKYGKLTVLSFSHIGGTGKKKQGMWKCQCDCPKKTIKILSSSQIKYTQSCGCLRLEKITKRRVGNITYQFWGRFNRTCKQRKIEVKVTQDDVAHLLEEQNNRCSLSNMPIVIGDEGRTIEQTASIDRIDSLKCYDKDNIQWVHKDVNYMKCDFEQKYFIEACGMIYKNNSFEYDDKTNDWW